MAAITEIERSILEQKRYIVSSVRYISETAINSYMKYRDRTSIIGKTYFLKAREFKLAKHSLYKPKSKFSKNEIEALDKTIETIILYFHARFFKLDDLVLNEKQLNSLIDIINSHLASFMELNVEVFTSMIDLLTLDYYRHVTTFLKETDNKLYLTLDEVNDIKKTKNFDALKRAVFPKSIITDSIMELIILE